MFQEVAFSDSFLMSSVLHLGNDLINLCLILHGYSVLECVCVCV